MFGGKNEGPKKKFWSHKYFRVPDFWADKKFYSEKLFGPRKNLVKKSFWSKKDFLVWKSKVNPYACSFDNGKYSVWGQLSPGQMLHVQIVLFQDLIFVN